jgi:inhibitor of cysteine peptidase
MQRILSWARQRPFLALGSLGCLGITATALCCFIVLLLVPTDSATRLTEEDNGSTITLAPGEQIRLVLQGNPTTGYEWSVAELDPTVLRQIGEGEWRPDSIAVGSGGPYTFRFEAVAEGQSILHLIYRFEGREDEEPFRTFEATVIVTE